MPTTFSYDEIITSNGTFSSTAANFPFTTSSTTVSDTVVTWSNWVAYVDGNYLTVASVLTPEQERLRKIEEAKCEQEKAEAQAKARRLLEESLTPEQWTMFMEKKCFIVQGGKTKKQYRIDYGYGINIRELEILILNNLENSHKVVRSLCVHPNNSHEMPNEDTMLVQKLMLEDENSEEQLIKIANIHDSFAPALVAA